MADLADDARRSVPVASELEEMREQKDAAYLERNQVVAALAKCFPSGIAKTAIEGWSEDWHGCVYIDLPTGQASWHFHDTHAYLFEGLPPYKGQWDGHDTPEKYRRLAALSGQTAAPVAVKPLDAGWRKAFDEMLTALTDLCEAWEGDEGKYHGNVTRANNAARAAISKAQAAGGKAS